MLKVSNEIAFTFLVFQTFTICGITEIVTHIPAKRPIRSMKFIVFNFNILSSHKFAPVYMNNLTGNITAVFGC